jgi:hypothetical protein
MNVRNYVTILRRHLLPTTIVLMIGAGVAYGMKATPVTYAQSAVLEFSAGRSPAEPNLANPIIDPLIATEVMISEVMAGPSAQSQVRAVGGTGQFTIVPENLYSLQYPYYFDPSATLTATSTSAAAARRTFTAAARVLASRLAAIQQQAGVPRRHRIRTFIIGDAAPVAQPGSRVRVFGGIALLILVALLMVPVFLERHRGLIGRRRAASRRAGRPWQLATATPATTDR